MTEVGSDGFRNRGAEMTRLETFADAAFAFAITMLVISIGNIPRTFEELVVAMKGVPAFAACFVQIMLYWVGHRKWSRRYGLDDTPTLLITLGLIFVMLVYVYPLRLMFSALFAWLSGGWLPSEFAVRSAEHLIGLFVVYGLGSFFLSAMILLLYRHAERCAEDLGLSPLERVLTRGESVSWLVMTLTGLASAAFAWFLPTPVAVFAGFVYPTLCITMPIVATRYERKARAIRAGADA